MFKAMLLHKKQLELSIPSGVLVLYHTTLMPYYMRDNKKHPVVMALRVDTYVRTGNRKPDFGFRTFQNRNVLPIPLPCCQILLKYFKFTLML